MSIKKARRETISFKELLKTVPKEDFELYYAEHSKVETMEHFKIGSTVWYKYISFYRIQKSKDDINKLRDKTNLDKYGCCNQFQRVEHILNSYIEKDGSLEAHYKKNSRYSKTK